MSSLKKNARISGLLYFLHALTGGFGILYVQSAIFVPGDVTATANNLMASETLFRLSAVSVLIGQVLFLALALALYKLFKEVNKTYASLMLLLVVASVPITFLNTLTQFGVLPLLNGVEYLTAFEPGQLNAAILYLLDMHQMGIVLVETFWGLWLLPLGLLIIKSDFIPKIMGILLIIACCGYVAWSFSSLLNPDFAVMIAPITGIAKFGELPIIFWLLIKGVKKQNQSTEANVKS
jgi:hypothetical protein